MVGTALFVEYINAMEVFTIIIPTSSVTLFFYSDRILCSCCVFLICGDVLMCPFDVSDQCAHTQCNFVYAQLRTYYRNNICFVTGVQDD